MVTAGRAVGAGVLVGAALGLAVAWGRSSRQVRQPQFNPDVVARIETEGWRAYYDRRFLDGFRLLIELGQSEMGLNMTDALRASYLAVRGQMAYAGERGDAEAAKRWMTRYYRAVPRRDGVSPEDLAAAEIDYWVVHRRLVGQANKADLVAALARLHAGLFGGSVENMRASAEQRTLACNAVDRITGGTSADPDEDWRLVREHLTQGYRLAVAAAST